jgi:hypothetical protein
LLAATAAKPAGETNRPFRLDAEFAGWSGNAAIFHFEGDEQHPELWYKVAPPRHAAIKVRSPQQPLAPGTVLFRANADQTDSGGIDFGVSCDRQQASLLEKKLAKYQPTEKEPNPHFPPVRCTLRISLASAKAGNPHLLWEEARLVHAYPGETTYQYQEPRLQLGVRSPDGNTLLVGWVESNSFIYIFLPLSSAKR